MGIGLSQNDMTGWDFAGKNLTNAYFGSATLTGADFTDAEISGAGFGATTDSGFTTTQLYSTASYEAGDLTGVTLSHNDLTGWNLAGQNLTNVYFYKGILTNANLSGSNLADAFFGYATLTGANLSNSNLTDAFFSSAILADVDFTGAEVLGANFSSATDFGFTMAQLYSTASYQAGDLAGISLRGNDLAGWNFAGKNLTDASFLYATLTDVDFTGAEVRGTSFYSTTDSGFTEAQLYSTASYQAADLTGIDLSINDLTNWDFTGKNLSDAFFPLATLTNADLSGSNLTAVSFWSATLTNADFTGADARVARYMNLSSAVTHNFIHPDGYVEGLDITTNEEMRLWDFNHDAPVPILIQNALSIAPTGTLRAVFEDDDWGSTFTFEAGIGVSLNGTLELLIDSREGSNVSSMVGTTFDLFDWTGVTPSGTFAQITTADGLVWDTSDLYTTGEVTLLSAPSILFADFDDNGIIDEADYLTWRSSYGSTTDLDADGNGDGVIDAADYTVWRDHLVASASEVPEPAALALALLGMASLGWYRRRSG